MNKLRYIIMALLLGISALAFGKDKPVVNPKIKEKKKTNLTIVVKDLIPLDVPGLGTFLSERDSNNLDALTEATNPDSSIVQVNVIVDSHGGSVNLGMEYLNRMKLIQQRGVPVICSTSTKAYSMGFMILMGCTKTRIYRKATVLFHCIRITMGDDWITAPIAREIASSLARADGPMLELIHFRVNAPYELVYNTYYYLERMWTGAQFVEFAANPKYFELVDLPVIIKKEKDK